MLAVVVGMAVSVDLAVIYIVFIDSVVVTDIVVDDLVIDVGVSVAVVFFDVAVFCQSLFSTGHPIDALRCASSETIWGLCTYLSFIVDDISAICQSMRAGKAIHRHF